MLMGKMGRNHYTGLGMMYHIENYAWLMVSSAEMLAAIIIIVIIIIIHRGSQETEPGLETSPLAWGSGSFPFYLSLHTP